MKNLLAFLTGLVLAILAVALTPFLLIQQFFVYLSELL